MHTLVHTPRQAITIAGDDVALSPSSNIEIDVLPHDDYVGDGTLVIRVVDDDRK